MKGANRYERFKMREVARSEIQHAYYNPRQISESALKKLKAFLKSKEGGLLSPLTWNEKTENLVSGHQRLTVLDTLHRGKPYRLTVAVVSMSEPEEVKANVFMNNPSTQGEWDIDRLQGLVDLVPDLDFEKDLGFDEEELDILGLIDFEDTSEEEETSKTPTGKTPDQHREEKKKTREKAKLENKNGDGYSYVSADYTLTFVFPNSDEKERVAEALGFDNNPARLNSEVLLNLIK